MNHSMTNKYDSFETEMFLQQWNVSLHVDLLHNRMAPETQTYQTDFHFLIILN